MLYWQLAYPLEGLTNTGHKLDEDGPGGRECFGTRVRISPHVIRLLLRLILFTRMNADDTHATMSGVLAIQNISSGLQQNLEDNAVLTTIETRKCACGLV
jgi:hypothetical protein